VVFNEIRRHDLDKGTTRKKTKKTKKTKKHLDKKQGIW
jgi:hypothetical protein